MAVETVLSWALPPVLFLAALLLFYLYGTWTLSTWSEQAIAGPKPAAFFGNANQLRDKGLMGTLLEWKKTYGKVCGFYMFRRPFLLTTDLDIVKEVMIKDFNNFTDRGNAPPLQSYPRDASLVFAKGDVWRRQRHTMTPTFSASKLKHMNMFISQCCRNLVKSIHDCTVAGTPLDVKKTFGSFTLDVIAGTGFGFECNSLEEKDNVFLNAVRRFLFLRATDRPSPAFLLASIFPALDPVLKALGFGKNRSEEMQFILQTICNTIEERKKTSANEKGRVDLLQLMLDAEATEEEVKANPHDKRLTKDEIVAQSFAFFLAGYETTSTTLQYLTYLLAVNPDKQDKLYDEIVTAIGDAEPTYENVSNITYLDSCIREALRCYPPAPMFGRKCNKTRTIKGITIPTGSSVMVNIYGLMQDEDYFPEPEKFIPERFEEDKDKIPTLIKEMVFGAGPRQCIGMRLALFEAKMATVSVVRKFKFVKIKDTPETITFESRGLTALSAPDRTVLVGTQLRE